MRSLLRPLAAVASLALATSLIGCDGLDSDESNVTDVKNSAVKKQSIGNCWAYASIGWAESLHLTSTGEELNLSESWISYWHWYEQIAGAPSSSFAPLAQLDKGQISTGGWFGLAAEIMRRYGVIDEGRFIPEEAEAARSARQSSALAAINESLKNGALKDPAARKDRKLVRKELDKAWGLTSDTIALLDNTFGQDATRTVLSSGFEPIPGGGQRLAKTIQVGGVSGTPIMLSDAIGQPVSKFDFLRRTGKFAWNETDYPTSDTSRRTFLTKMQKAMHQGMPVIMVWFVDFAAMDGQNRFMAPPEVPGRQGGHMTVVEDYQINDVPGFGTLKAGEVVTDQKALDAALSPQANIEFIRIKNSWGTALAPSDSGEEFRGYHDLYMKYLNGPLTKCTEKNGDACGTKTKVPGLTAMVLPPDSFKFEAKSKPATCDVNVCVAGPALKADVCASSGPSDTGACVELVCSEDSFCCSNSWDSQCVSEASSICGLCN